MRRTSIRSLAATWAVVAVAALVVTWRFYAFFARIPVVVSVTLWGMAALCCYFAWKVKTRKEEGRIGLDRSQLNPVMAAQLLVVGKASAWTGSIVGGLYAGVTCYVLLHAGELVAAAEDMPGAIASSLGGVALVAAGVWLERACEVPPPSDGAVG